ncbi:hypothetical protein RFI_37202 [Reticulomyxa filosa]|uniref:Fe2OG dioxygenase domain-containing protein n=1 Tax=Reticulomyxa filosa TaxID=46433 RepID=X6LHP4_RETFI|nr:hypothetical protein RFI_37202 [Reticulomyxa filosa]|eukprot:ETO00245.1 hypothetical protein RFI_37202 [Reticulomyxa filosa]
MSKCSNRAKKAIELGAIGYQMLPHFNKKLSISILKKPKLQCPVFRHMTTTTKHPRIPIVDLSKPMSEISALVHEALSDTGFMYVRNAAISKQHIESVLSMSRKFFTECDSSVKRTVEDPISAFRGYYVYKGTQSNVLHSNDNIECFSIGKECANPYSLRSEYFKRNGLPESIWKAGISKPNQWPKLPSQQFTKEFRETMQSYYNACVDTSTQILRLIAYSLGMTGEDVDYFLQFHNKWDCNLEPKFYPKFSVQKTEEKIRLSEHRDLTSITLLVQDQLSGLQVWDDHSHEWIDAPLSLSSGEGIILCNTGDFMAMWTGGLYKSTLHRVKASPFHSHHGPIEALDRISVVFFAWPNHEAVIQPLQRFTSTSHPPITCGDLMPFCYNNYNVSSVFVFALLNYLHFWRKKKQVMMLSFLFKVIILLRRETNIAISGKANSLNYFVRKIQFGYSVHQSCLSQFIKY